MSVIDQLLELERHRDACVECTPKPWTVCAAAARLLQRLSDETAAKMAPEPVKPGAA